MASWFDILIVSIAGALAVGGSRAGKNKVFSFVVGNYIFLIGGLGLRYGLEYLGKWLVAFGDQPLAIGFSYLGLGNLLINASVTIVLVVYIIFLIKIYRDVPIRLEPFSRDWIDQIVLLLVLVLGILSFVFTVTSLLFGPQLFDPQFLEKVIGPLTDNLRVYYFWVFSPLWIFFHAVATLFLLSSAHPSLPSFSLNDDDINSEPNGLVG